MEKKTQIEALLFIKTFIQVLAKYSNYSNFFLIKNVIELSGYIKINNYIIELEKSKQLLFSLIYSLKLVELEILKTYIKINLTNSFF